MIRAFTILFLFLLAGCEEKRDIPVWIVFANPLVNGTEDVFGQETVPNLFTDERACQGALHLKTDPGNFRGRCEQYSATKSCVKKWGLRANDYYAWKRFMPSDWGSAQATHVWFSGIQDCIMGERS